MHVRFLFEDDALNTLHRDLREKKWDLFRDPGFEHPGLPPSQRRALFATRSRPYCVFYLFRVLFTHTHTQKRRSHDILINKYIFNITDLDSIPIPCKTMAATFDQYDKSSWYFGAMSRQDASDLLMGEKEGGVFLVRDSTSIQGDFVLCVREDSKVSHYIINKIQQGDQIRYRIGDQMFPDIPNLLAFYKLHYLDTTPLIRPAPKKTQRVIAKYDFEGNDSDDLPFRKGEILTIISKDEEQWWTAKNSLGQTGSVPVPYVQKYEEDNHSVMENNSRPESGGSSMVNSNSIQVTGSQMPYPESGQGTTRRSNIQRTLPAFAKVKQARVPNAYDKTALKLEVGDVIKVTKTNMNGQWEGELHGKIGHFPFTHVEFVDNETGEDNQEI